MWFLEVLRELVGFIVVLSLIIPVGFGIYFYEKFIKKLKKM